MSIKNRKLQVFVSSTFTDLIAERQAAVEAILSTGNIPAGMELFAAGDQSQMEVIKEWIRESDVYLLILGSRYGSIEPESGKSYTHLEYEYALEIGKPHFAVVISDEGETLKVEKQGKGVLERDHSEKYNQFKKQVIDNKLVHFWNDLGGIELAIHKSLANFNKREELIGWVRGDQAVNSGVLAEELARLGKENAELRNEINHIRDRSNTDYYGLSFSDLFAVLENKKYTLSEIWRDTPKYHPKYNELEVLIEELSHLNPVVTANQMLIVFGLSINSTIALSVKHYKKFFIFLHQNGLIDLGPSDSMSHKTCEFTEVGRKYFNRLCSVEYQNLCEKINLK